jgi:predicted nucleic acid-binding protein
VPGVWNNGYILRSSRGGGLGGNLTTDALIAAHAIENAATLFSNDRDFDRFSGLKWTNPLAARPKKI